VSGAAEENILEVLLPDYPDARTIVFLGESMEPIMTRIKKMTAAHELARFSVPDRMKDSDQVDEGGER